MVVGVQEYLESLPEAVTTRLYRSPSSCLSVFRLLAPLAKTILLAFIFTDDPVPIKVVDMLVKPNQRRRQIEAIQALKHMHILKERYAAQTLVVNATFSRSLRQALTSGPENAMFGVPATDQDNGRVDRPFLKTYSKNKWELILHYMVGSSHGEGGARAPGEGVLALLQQSGLMEGASLRHLQITSAGFQFLLQDLNSQVWTLLLHYLNLSTNNQLDPVEVLNFIFMLGSLELGTAYSLRELSETQAKMLGDLSDLGIVYQPSRNSTKFYPAALATILTSDTDVAEIDAAAAARASTGMIIIETNYRIYAYTESPLQISILSLFCHLKSRFSNLVVGRLSRESVRRALSRGITADQIIQYLTTNAHEQMRESAKGGHVLPPTVSDQIKLWQLEMDRMRATQGFLYREFPSAKEYNLIASYAQDLGALLWRNDNKRMFFVDRESHGQVLDYINRKMTDN